MNSKLAAHNNTLWLAEPSRLQALAARVASMPTCPTAKELVKARAKEFERAAQLAAKPIRTAKGKVGVIPIHGAIDQHMSFELMKAGGVSCDFVGAALDAMLNDASIDAIVMDIDSPGGSVYGVPELADKIYNARGRKPIYAIANSMAASALFWIASAADQLCCTPSGDVGSVGVYMMHVDMSKAMEEEGITVNLIYSAKYKVEQNPYQPLNEETRAHLQQRSDAIYNDFLNALKRNRGVSLGEVRANFGQGRLVRASEALDVKMIDRVCTFDELMSKLLGGPATGGGSSRANADVTPAVAAAPATVAEPVAEVPPQKVEGPSVEILRMRHEHRKRLEGAE